MPNFKQVEAELKNRLDKWLYFIKHLEDFQTIPAIFRDEVFVQAFEKAELANFNQEDLTNYENSLKSYRDLKGVIDTAFDDGKMEGIVEGIIEGKKAVARALKASGVSLDIIANTTGLSIDEIDRL